MTSGGTDLWPLPDRGRAPLSPRNSKVLRLRRLGRSPSFRRAEKAFVAEGPKVVAAALDAGSAVEALYVSSGAADPVVGRALDAGIPVHQVTPAALDRAADAVTPQPVLAVVRRVDVPLERIRSADLLLVCVDLGDPGNLGAVLRSAEATGVSGIICCKGTVDVYNPKCVRASAGALFHLPVVVEEEPADVLDTLATWGVRRFGAQAAGGAAPEDCDLTRPTAIVLGNEGHGLRPGLGDRLDGLVSIPMSGTVDSLNVSVAAAVLGFEAARQRRRARLQPGLGGSGCGLPGG